MRKAGSAIGTLLLSVASAAGAQAQTAPPAPPAALETPAPAPSPAQLALGRRMAEAGDFNAIIGAMGHAQAEQIAREAPDLSDAERERLRATALRVLAEQRARLLDRLAPVYARVYPPDQLAAILAFLESPAGRAYTGGFLRLVPQIAAELEGVDFARDVRAAFCRETGKLCGEAAR